MRAMVGGCEDLRGQLAGGLVADVDGYAVPRQLLVRVRVRVRVTTGGLGLGLGLGLGEG